MVVSIELRLIKSLPHHTKVCDAFTVAHTFFSEERRKEQERETERKKPEHLSNQYGGPVNGFLHLCRALKNLWERQTNRHSSREREAE